MENVLIIYFNDEATTTLENFGNYLNKISSFITCYEFHFLCIKFKYCDTTIPILHGIEKYLL